MGCGQWCCRWVTLGWRCWAYPPFGGRHMAKGGSARCTLHLLPPMLQVKNSDAVDTNEAGSLAVVAIVRVR